MATRNPTAATTRARRVAESPCVRLIIASIVHQCRRLPMPPLSLSMASLGHGSRIPSASSAPQALLPRATPGKLLQHLPETGQMLVSVRAALRQVQSAVGAGVGDAPVDNPRELNAVHVGRHN